MKNNVNTIKYYYAKEKKRTTEVFTSEILRQCENNLYCFHCSSDFSKSPFTRRPLLAPLYRYDHSRQGFLQSFCFPIQWRCFFFITFFSFQSDMIRCSISKFKFRVQRSDIAIDLNITFRTLIVFDVSFY